MSREYGLGIKPAVKGAAGWLQRRPQVFRDGRRLRAASGSSSTLYLGFAGQKNIGDDAIRDAHVRWTLREPVTELPVHHVSEVLRGVMRDAPRPRPALIGGGTLVGRPDWLRRIDEYSRRGWVSHWSVMGAGVEDPEFSGKRTHASWQDLERWAEVLGGFGEVTVRGPLSLATLDEVGLRSRIVGDPALLFALDRRQVDVDANLIAMSVAEPEDVWGGDPGATVHALSGAARDLVAAGRRLRLLVMHPADLAPSRTVAAAVGQPGAVEVLVPGSADEFLDQVRPCGAMIGQRLHAVVLASAADVPSLAIEYRPKCLDFQLSIGRGEWTLSTRGLSSGAVVEHTRELLQEREKHSAGVREGVDALMPDLLADAQRVRVRIGDPSGASR